MRTYLGTVFSCLYVTSQVSLSTRVQPTRLPSGATKVVEAPSGDATTTLYLDASKNSLHPLGVLTSIVDTFINGGTTTEYMTQHVDMGSNMLSHVLGGSATVDKGIDNGGEDSEGVEGVF